MQKHGQEGWKIEHRHHGGVTRWDEAAPDWNWWACHYRAVGPRKRVQLKRGMDVKYMDTSVALAVTDELHGRIYVCSGCDCWSTDINKLTYYRWPNGDGTWLPIEGEPEIISMEGVE